MTMTGGKCSVPLLDSGISPSLIAEQPADKAIYLRWLVPFPPRDQHRDDDHRESDDHPVLKRDAQKGELLYHPVVHRTPAELLKRYS